MKMDVKIIFLGIALSLILAFPGCIFADSFYVQLDINESVASSSSTVDFFLYSAKLLYGDYDNLVAEIYDAENSSSRNYIIRAYDPKGEMLGSYSVPSSLISFDDSIIFEDEPASGMLTVNDSGTITVIFPYDESRQIAHIRIVKEGLPDVKIDIPADDLVAQADKIKLCKNENEGGDLALNKCCKPLVPSIQEDGSFICTACGDKKCSQYENYDSCPQDCSTNIIPINSSKKLFKKNVIITIITIIIFLLIILSVCFAVFIVKKSKKTYPDQNFNQEESRNNNLKNNIK